MADARPPSPTTSPARPPRVDLVLLGVGVMAVSTAAPLIRGADAPSLAVAMWRTTLALPVLGAVVAVRARGELRGLSRVTRRRAALAGLLLALHFALWVPSVAFTSVASAVALVSTQPVWAALIARRQGEHVPRGTWTGIVVAMAGAVLLAGVDLSIAPRALLGDVMALGGAALVAAYMTVGADVRRSVSTGVYALVCYGVASVVLLAVCLVGRQPVVGYEASTWLVLLGIMAGPQLLGHTVFNRVLRTISPTLVSVAILFEVVGAALLAWLFFDEVPPVSAVPAAVLIAVGVVLVIHSTTDGGDGGGE